MQGHDAPARDERTEPHGVRRGTSGLTADFSSVAPRCDATRDLPESQIAACYNRLVEHRLLPPAGRILDAGCGTGQVSLPLAARGYVVRGIDVSTAMTDIAQSKVRAEWRAEYVVGDVCGLPDDDASFDAAVLSKLLMHVEDWRRACREMIRVVRPGGHIIQISEKGAFANSVRRFFSERADALGFTNRFLGLAPRASRDLHTFMAGEGCKAVPIDMSDLRWDAVISYGEALNRIRDRLFAEFWRLPDDVYARLIAETEAWINAHPGGPGTRDHLSPYLVVEVFRTPNG